MIGETGKDTVFDGTILIFIGIPVYLADQWRRTRRATIGRVEGPRQREEG
jgi:hypothetical protein